MPTWNDVRDHMRRSYRLADDKPNLMSLVWSYDGGRSQKIVMRRYEAFGRTLLELKSAVARKQDVEAEVILRRNTELPLATLSMSGDYYFVVYNLFVENLVFSDLDMLLSRVAAVADTLEEEYSHVDVF